MDALSSIGLKNSLFRRPANSESFSNHFENEQIASDFSVTDPGETDKIFLRETGFYQIQVNPRPGNPTPIFISIANVSHLRLAEDNLSEIFRLANLYTLNTPYPLGDNPMRHGELIAYRTNHNGTHSARQVAYLDALFDLVSKEGSPVARSAYLSLSEDEVMNLRLAAYFLRSGRADESSHLDPPADDYNTRSALIYEQYAEQLGVCSTTIHWIKKLIINSCKSQGVRDSDIDADPKNKFGFEVLSMVHELDLARCFDAEKMEYVIARMRRRLNYFLSSALRIGKDTCLNQLMQYAKDVCEATGCQREFDNVLGDRDQFMACSVDGDYCWWAVKSIPIPMWS